MKPALRVTSLDGLRGLLAAFVMFAHYLALTWNFPGLLSTARGAVVIFFLMSGYVLTLGWDGHFPAFLVRRFLRLWPVFALCMGFAALVLNATPRWTEYFWYPMANAGSNIGFDVPMWSLFVEAWAMLLMPLVVWAEEHPARGRGDRNLRWNFMLYAEHALRRLLRIRQLLHAIPVQRRTSE